MDIAVACKSLCVRDHAASRNVTHGGSRLLNVSVYEDMFDHLLDFDWKTTIHSFSLKEIKSNQTKTKCSIWFRCIVLTAHNVGVDNSELSLVFWRRTYSNRTSKVTFYRCLNFSSLLEILLKIYWICFLRSEKLGYKLIIDYGIVGEYYIIHKWIVE